ncbi:hypothetical protein GCM10009809_04780 [Isoptericola hypogeus]|uniref:HupE / UreJ protein n=1 Tax=Isoptericola hypogeus TaxID=300179 RepID=A0ABP4UWE1_9MICO
MNPDRTTAHAPRATSFARRAALALAALAAVAWPAGPAAAHDATTDAYADVTAARGADVRVELDVEYDLLMKSAWLTAEAYEATGAEAQTAQLAENAAAVTRYVTERFGVAAGERHCAPAPVGDARVHERAGATYATLTLDYACDAGGTGGDVTHTVFSALFPDVETFVHSTETVVTYDLDGEQGSVVLTPAEPTFTTGDGGTAARLGEFFVLGAEHLLLGPDHVLFLLALVVASRRLRDVVLVATTFTVAHSVTFLLAATGVVSVPGAVVEPIIAASITAVALGSLWALRDDPTAALETSVEPRGRWFELSRTEAARLAVVFAFGLVHGLGFAGALGLDEPWSWSLLASLLVFNLGIEVVQLAIIAVVFPLLTALRRRAPRAARWVTGMVAAAVAVVGLVWFVQRVLGLG